MERCNATAITLTGLTADECAGKQLAATVIIDDHINIVKQGSKQSVTKS